jgi:uncharacterized membrane protein YuzA (DUF378 family)
MDVSEDVYYSKLVSKIAMVFLVIGALNWGLIGAFRVNFVERILGKNAMIARIIYILVGIAALYLAFNRDTYLPFLGESVFPCSVLPDQIPAGATRSIQINVQPGAKVVYWATEPSDGGSVPNYRGAYREYQNAGVTTADASGVATLKVREPQPYTVPFKGRLEPHILRASYNIRNSIHRINCILNRYNVVWSIL